MNAPDRLLYSGLGDLFCSINTHAEWRLASLYTENGFNQELVNILEQLEDEFINGFVVGDENLENLADLIKLIFYSGLVMTVTGSSGSASQSEHIFVHGFDLLYPEIGGKLLHGEKVAFFTHFSLKIWSRLLEEEGLFGQLNTNNYAAALDKILCVHPIYREEMDRIKDIKLLQLREIKKIMYDKKTSWHSLRSEVISALENSKYYSRVKFLNIVAARLEPTLLSNLRVENAIKLSPFIRDRFTIADLYVLAGYRVEDLLR